MYVCTISVELRGGSVPPQCVHDGVPLDRGAGGLREQAEHDSLAWRKGGQLHAVPGHHQRPENPDPQPRRHAAAPLSPRAHYLTSEYTP